MGTGQESKGAEGQREGGRAGRLTVIGDVRSIKTGWKIKSIIFLSNFLNCSNIQEFYFSNIFKYCFTCHTILQAQKFSIFSPVITLYYHISYYQNRTFCMLKFKNFPGGSAPLAPRKGQRPWTPLGAPPPDPYHSSLGGASCHLGRERHATSSLRSQPGLATTGTVLPPGLAR